jgi:hypothetical protein
MVVKIGTFILYLNVVFHWYLFLSGDEQLCAFLIVFGMCSYYEARTGT